MQNLYRCTMTLIMKTLYFDMNGGLSGDMTVAGLMKTAEMPDDKLSELTTELLGDKVSIKNEYCFINGIKCKRLSIDSERADNHHRNFSAIKEMILSSQILSEQAKNDSINMFRIIAEAESQIHGQSIDKVHFHEVGAIDSIIDIVSTAWLIDQISPDKIIFSTPLIGSGKIKSAHGIIPVPSPATLEILKDMDIKRLDIKDELTTPTGAAIIKYYADKVNDSFQGKVLKTSYSTGTKTFESLPNLLRIMILDDTSSGQSHSINEIQANIDDMTGEEMGFLMNKLFKEKCLDAFFSPVYMKKNRPGYKISVLCKTEETEKFAGLLLLDSSTAGVRISSHKRVVLNREYRSVKLNGDEVTLKILSNENILKIYPEYEDIARISQKTDKPFALVYREALRLMK